MDIRNIKAFIVLAETLNYHKASQILHISQPALTKKINALEEEFGALLFSRGRGGTRLTDFGQKLLRMLRNYWVILSSFRFRLIMICKMIRHITFMLALVFLFMILEKWKSECF
ncbi:LysR family transcriptional regulator [Photorhabdus luminescens]|uniref:LysR family transcriptional regulator n=1 Tax=Photorhabdus luminescens TaxID=29488 RepID=UPI002108C65A|nr:LysR family transcriptional regulator [Photorhabdus luminescens]